MDYADEAKVPFVPNDNMLNTIQEKYNKFVEILAKEFRKQEIELSKPLIQAIHKAYADALLHRLWSEKEQFDKVWSEKSKAFQNDPRHKTVAELERLLQTLAPLREACESLKKKIYQLCYSD